MENQHKIYVIVRCLLITNNLINRRMPKCNTVLQSENDLFEPEIQPNSLGKFGTYVQIHVAV